MDGRASHARGFRAMSVWIEVTGIAVPEAAVDEAAGRLAELAERWEATFSRFRPESELSRLNERSGRWERVSPELLAVLDAALGAWRATGGRFDPALLPAMVRAGYDRSFERIGEQGLPLAVPPPVRDRAGAPYEIDRLGGRVRLAEGVRLDLGGIAKGAFVDRARPLVAGWPGACIDAGGDLRAWGLPPDGDRWRIGVEHPQRNDLDVAVIELAPGGGAVATSANNRRRWTLEGQTYHHLIDPRTGRPVAAEAISATAVARTAVAAEVETKALIVAAGRGQPLGLIAADLGIVWVDGRLAVIEGEGNDHACGILDAADRRHTA